LECPKQCCKSQFDRAKHGQVNQTNSMAHSTTQIIAQHTEFIKGNNIDPDSPSYLWCLPLENNAKHFQTNMIWAYNANANNNQSEEFMPIKKLKDSLILLINQLPVIAGTIGAEDSSGNLQLNVNNQGVLWAEASMSAPLEDFLPNRFSRYKPENSYALDYTALNSLELQQRPISYKPSEPILSLQLTRFSCHSLVIAVSGQHALFDGSAMGQFMIYWAQLAMTGQLTGQINWADRSFLMKLPEELKLAQEPKKPRFINYIKREELPAWNPPSTKGNPTSRIIHFPAGEIENLKKAACSAPCSHEKKENPVYLSSYDVLYAHFIHSIYSVQAKLAPGTYSDPSKSIIIAQAFNGRKAFGFNSEKNYFGQLAFWLGGEIRLSALINLQELAAFIHFMHSTQNRAELAEFNRWIIPKGKLGYSENHLLSDFMGRDFHISSWAKGRYYSADFGWGQPDFCGPTSHLIPKVILVLDSANNRANEPAAYDIVLRLDEAEYEELMKIIHKYK
jgi:shikimate O-hydroxycinnamoyltransferase